MPIDYFSDMSPACNHTTLNLESSTHADDAGFHRPTSQQRATGAGKRKQDADGEFGGTFPAPLVLPGDDLSFDTRCPPQSLLSWVREKERNEVTPERNVVYLASSPDIKPEINFIHAWSNPQIKGATGGTIVSNKSTDVPSPNAKHVLEYLKAFYHGMNVKLLPAGLLHFSRWDDTDPKSSKAQENSNIPKYIGLTTLTETIGIRTRPSKDGVFKGQLNLDDLLDTVISILPDDGYALLMLVEHDIFEDEDDDFCCGRAYGGSRVAVISTARYNPSLDDRQDVEREHAWPASHCDAYMRECCGAPSKVKKAKLDASFSHQTPLNAAVSAHASLPTPQTPSHFSSLWLSRVCQTASHELGHCFGMDHCVYYACVMQATGSLAEDVRQPPYLCPVDLAKMLKATGANERQRYEALLTICGRLEDGGAGWFRAFKAWIVGRLREMKDGDEGLEKKTADLSTKPASKGKAGSKKAPIELSP